jgi:hypothetical protein
MGDLSCIMPVVHPYAAGAKGTGHGNNYYIENPEAACVENAKWQIAMLLVLLGNGAQRAKKVVEEFKPLFPSKEAYLEYMDAINSSGDRIVYNEDGTANVNIGLN